jgi:hypothetical protein
MMRILNLTLANFPSFSMPSKGMHGTSFPSFYVSCTCIIYFASLAYFIGKYYLVDSGYPNRIGILHLTKEAHITYPNFGIV